MRPAAGAAVLAALLSVAVSGCSGSSPSSSTSSSGSTHDGSQSATSSAGGSGTKGGSAADDAIAKVMGSSDKLPVLATSHGTLDAAVGSSSVVAEVLQVMTSPQATRVTWRLKSATADEADTKSYQLARPPLFDTRLLGVVDPKTKKTFHPYTYVPMSRDDGQDNACACSSLPDSVNDKGTVLFAVLPPLPTGTTSVNVTLPGFKTMTGVKVAS